MRVVVLGAGLLGVTTAYYLQQLGHEVTVIDRHSMPAAKARGGAAASAEGGPVLRAGAAAPRGSRTVARLQGLRSGLRRRFGQFIDRAIGAPSRSTHLEHLVRLAAYSRRNVLALREEVGLTQAPRGTGLLSVYTDAKAFHARLARASHWSGLGCEERLFSADEAVAVEPALQPIRNQLVGATYLQEDPARDPAEFAASMVFLCRAAGVRFMNGHQVVSLAEREGRIDHVELLDGEGRLARVRGHAYVLALGASSVPHAQA
ncbi:MAG TPA: FAD-dependent oxidoreductase, partial [Variovorax sp.]